MAETQTPPGTCIARAALADNGVNKGLLPMPQLKEATTVVVAGLTAKKNSPEAFVRP